MTLGASPACAVRTVPIVKLDEGVEGLGPGLLTLLGASVLPLLCERPVHAYEPSVLPGTQGPGVLVPCTPALEQLVEVARPVRRPVVGHDPLDRDAELIEELQRPPHERAGRGLLLVGQQLGVSHPVLTSIYF